MSIFDIFKKKVDKKAEVEIRKNIQSENKTIKVVKPGTTVAQRIELDFEQIDKIRKCFVAFDVETTGLSPISDRIVELGAVIFSEGNVVNKFSTLVNPNVSIPEAASSINGITNAMLMAAPSEEEAFQNLVNFLGEALSGNLVMCAHNARFDFDFLCHTLSRLGFDANIVYVDTLNLARKYICCLNSYKQCAIEEYLGLRNRSAHRAFSDAENCGYILYHILNLAQQSFEEEKQRMEETVPTQGELEVCAYIQAIITERCGDIQLLRYRKNKSSYVDAEYLYSFLRFKFAKKGKYAIVKKDCSALTSCITEPCSQSEGGTEFVRVYFSSPFDLKPLAEYIYDEFLRCYKSAQGYISYNDARKREVEKSLRYVCALNEERVETLLETIKEQTYPPVNISPVKVLSSKQSAEKKQPNSKKEKLVKREELKPRGRAVLQIDDAGNVIKEFDTITAAANEVGVNTKSIRDAANGVQKHAGGFRWIYKEENIV